MKPETKIADLTVGQFSELVRQLLGTVAPQKYVYGLQGLAMRLWFQSRTNS